MEIPHNEIQCLSCEAAKTIPFYLTLHKLEEITHSQKSRCRPYIRYLQNEVLLAASDRRTYVRSNVSTHVSWDHPIWQAALKEAFSDEFRFELDYRGLVHVKWGPVNKDLSAPSSNVETST